MLAQRPQVITFTSSLDPRKRSISLAESFMDELFPITDSRPRKVAKKIRRYDTAACKVLTNSDLVSIIFNHGSTVFTAADWARCVQVSKVFKQCAISIFFKVMVLTDQMRLERRSTQQSAQQRVDASIRTFKDLYCHYDRYRFPGRFPVAEEAVHTGYASMVETIEFDWPMNAWVYQYLKLHSAYLSCFRRLKTGRVPIKSTTDVCLSAEVTLKVSSQWHPGTDVADMFSGGDIHIFAQLPLAMDVRALQRHLRDLDKFNGPMDASGQDIRLLLNRCFESSEIEHLSKLAFTGYIHVSVHLPLLEEHRLLGEFLPELSKWNISSLQLTLTCLSEPILVAIIQRCPNLKRLVIHPEVYNGRKRSKSFINKSLQLYDFLRHLDKAGLESMVLPVTTGDIIEAITPLLQPVPCFQHLRHLRLVSRDQSSLVLSSEFTAGLHRLLPLGLKVEAPTPLGHVLLGCM